MKRGPIGVWFSVALVLLGAGALAGRKLGSRAAYYWTQHQERKQERLQGPERAHVERILTELDMLEFVEVYGFAAHNQEQIEKNYLPGEIKDLERRMRQPDVPDEVKPVIALRLGLAYIDASMEEERDNNNQLAASYMQSAQILMRSLGWQDYSEETLRTVARRELDKWNAPALTKDNKK